MLEAGSDVGVSLNIKVSREKANGSKDGGLLFNQEADGVLVHLVSQNDGPVCLIPSKGQPLENDAKSGWMKDPR